MAAKHKYQPIGCVAMAKLTAAAKEGELVGHKKTVLSLEVSG
jgi:hypothetical protein